MNQVIHIFKNADMLNQHDGLAALARKKKVRVDQLGAGEHVLFLNAALNRLKMYSANNLLSYWKARPGEKLNLNMIQEIPRCFDAKTGMNWEEADRISLEKLFTKEKI